MPGYHQPLHTYNVLFLSRAHICECVHIHMHAPTYVQAPVHTCTHIHVHTCELIHSYTQQWLLSCENNVQKVLSTVHRCSKAEQGEMDLGHTPVWSLRTLSAHRKRSARNADLSLPWWPKHKLHRETLAGKQKSSEILSCLGLFKEQKITFPNAQRQVPA